jgi:hypothetical protein
VGVVSLQPLSPQVANGGNNFQIWRLAVNSLNKQSWITGREWYFSFGVGWGGQLMLIIKQQNVTNGTLWFWVGWSANARYKTTECYEWYALVLGGVVS